LPARDPGWRRAAGARQPLRRDPSAGPRRPAARGRSAPDADAGRADPGFADVDADAAARRPFRDADTPAVADRGPADPDPGSADPDRAAADGDAARADRAPHARGADRHANPIGAGADGDSDAAAAGERGGPEPHLAERAGRAAEERGHP